MPELRKDPVVGRWVIISLERGKRPSDFGEHLIRKKGGFCPFCEGNEYTTPPEVLAFRPGGGKENGPGWSLRVVPNKFPALHVEGELGKVGEGMFDRMNGIGAHEVIVETPDHQQTLATVPLKAVEDVLWAVQLRIADLRKDKRFKYIVVFKNEGEAAGATLEHSHSQLIALPIVPFTVREELVGARRYYEYKERCIYCDIIREEIHNGIRVVSENRDFVAIAPYAPRAPFETWILPKNHETHYDVPADGKFGQLAEILQRTLKQLDRTLETPPYNFMIHSSPFGNEHNEYYHWHLEIVPKLTKIAGFEWGSGFHINPTPPEEAARFLREARI